MGEALIPTPAGPFRVTIAEGAIVAADWKARETQTTDDSPLAQQARQQLDAYFAGTRQDFDLPLRPKASPFQQEFYNILTAIPYGHTRQYGDIAKQMGASAQAIGQACGGNPIGVFIPCHRVLGAAGLGGYSARGGVETKVMLLRLEGAASLLI